MQDIFKRARLGTMIRAIMINPMSRRLPRLTVALWPT
jgi:hypothetical protein